MFASIKRRLPLRIFQTRRSSNQAAMHKPEQSVGASHHNLPHSSRIPNEILREIAATTLASVDEGVYESNGVSYDIKEAVQFMNENTSYYPPNSELAEWSTDQPETPGSAQPTEISLVECSTLVGCHILHEQLTSVETENKKIGVLNFASARNPGGGFIRGSQAQEESIARSSSLYPSLMTRTAQKFYTLHNRDPKEGYYSHAMIYSPRVQIIRDDRGGWLEPLEVDILTSPAVNAGVVRRYLRQIGSDDETDLNASMKERMARLLYLFEKQGVKNLVLGSFGTGVFRNNVDVVAGLWAELIVKEGARFKHSFERIVFAILGTPTFKTFQDVLGGNAKVGDVSAEAGNVDAEGGNVNTEDSNIDADASGVGAGTSKVDAGTGNIDADASDVDAGTSKVDAGTSNIDADASDVDAGTSKVDAGISNVGAGTSNVDAEASGKEAQEGQDDVEMGEPDEAEHPKL